MFWVVGRKNKVRESLFKTKRIISNFYILFNNSQNVINNFYYKMNIFINLPFEFLRKNLLFRLVGPELNPVLVSKSKLVLTSTIKNHAI